MDRVPEEDAAGKAERGSRFGSYPATRAHKAEIEARDHVGDAQLSTTWETFMNMKREERIAQNLQEKDYIHINVFRRMLKQRSISI